MVQGILPTKVLARFASHDATKERFLGDEEIIDHIVVSALARQHMSRP